MKPYTQELLTDFSIEKNNLCFKEALSYVESQLGKDYPVVIGGEKIFTEAKIISTNPANKEEVIGKVSKVDRELAEKAMQAALTTFETWKKWRPEHRANILFKAAALLKRRKHEFSAWMVKEA